MARLKGYTDEDGTYIELPPPPRPRTLKSASEQGDVEAMLYHLANGADVNATTAAGHFALGGAVIYGHLAAVAVLLCHGSDVNMESFYGWTPLYLAAWKGHADIAQLLIAAGAKLGARTTGGWNSPSGWAPIHVAAAGGHTAVVKVLVAAGCRPTARAGDRWTPLELAVKGGHRDTARYLRRVTRHRKAVARPATRIGEPVRVVAVRKGETRTFSRQELIRASREYTRAKERQE